MDSRWLALIGIFICIAVVAFMHGRAPVPVAENLSYGPAASQKLDIYAPQVCPADGCPVMVMMTGDEAGPTDEADRRWQDDAANNYVSRGVMVVAVNDVSNPASIEMAEALVWTRRNIAGYGGDSRRLFMPLPDSIAHLASKSDEDLVVR